MKNENLKGELKLFRCKQCGYEFETKKYIEREKYFVVDCPSCERKIFETKFIKIIEKDKKNETKKIVKKLLEQKERVYKKHNNEFINNPDKK